MKRGNRRSTVAFTASILVVLAGCGEKAQPETRTGPAVAAGNSPNEAKKPAADYAKYLPKTPLNEKVAKLLAKAGSAKGVLAFSPMSELEDLFPAAAGPLLELASNPNCEQRDWPLRCLDSGDLGEYKQRVIDFVAKAREDKDPDVRAAALAVAFSRSFPGANTELLRSVYKNDVPDVRTEVMSIVKNTESPDAARLLLLCDGLRDSDDSVRGEAIEALDELGPKIRPALAELRKVRDSKDVYVRSAVIEALGVCGQKEDWPAIRAACHSHEVPIQYRGAKALFHCDLNDPEVIETALAVFDAVDSSETRCQAAKVLAHVSPVQDRIVKRLAKALYEPDLPGEVGAEGATVLVVAKAGCLESLRFLGRDATAVYPEILAAPGRQDFLRHSLYEEALRTIAPKHPETIKIYKAKFAAGKFDVFDAEYLHALGDDAGQFSDELLKFLADTSHEKEIRREWLLEKLWRVRGLPADRLLPILLRELDNSKGNNCADACRAIGALGAKAAPAVPALCKLIENPQKDNYEKMRAIYALGDIGPPARESVPLLKRIYADPKTYRSEISDRWVAAAIALAKIDADERKKILATLRDDIHGKDADRQGLAIYMTGQIGAPAASLLDDLKKFAADRKSNFRREAVEALIGIGAEEDGVALALEELQSTDPAQRKRGCKIAAYLTKSDSIARVLPILERMRRDKDADIAGHAAGAIRAMTGEEVTGWETTSMSLGPQ
jgi:HEAT repeat protein